MLSPHAGASVADAGNASPSTPLPLVESAELMALPIAPHTARWEALVHEVVWNTGRAFGFQAFNVSSQDSRQWVPATLFVASDHLCSLLVKNAYLRDKAPQPDEQRFARATWELHSTIFNSYETHWCTNVGLHPRPHQLQLMMFSDFASPLVVHGLLTELALYFLTYSEAANLRHTPETLWFFYWAMTHSSSMHALWGLEAAAAATHVAFPSAQASLGGPSARQQRVVMRNAMQGRILHVQTQIGSHDPAVAAPARCAEVMQQLRGNLPAVPALMHLSATDSLLLVDLVAHGDGGHFVDHIVAPLFLLMSYEQDVRQECAEEIVFRLGYDDINESLMHKPTVRKLLGLLGVSKEQYFYVNGAYIALTQLGCVRPTDAACASTGACPNSGSGSSSLAFDAQKAAMFWGECVLVKTFRERRSWLAIFRAFYRVHCMHALLTHGLFAHSMAPYNLRIISSAVITHAFCHFLERFASALLTREQTNPLTTAAAERHPAATAAAQRAAERASAAAHTPGTNAASTGNGSASPRVVHTRRRTLHVEGAMFLTVFGVVEWLLVLVAVALIFTVQFLEGAPYQQLAHKHWLKVAGVYTAVHLVHALLTTRDGYTISLTAALRLPSLFRASSARPQATYWAAGSMKTGMRAFLLTALFWTQTLAIKILFDYNILLAPMAGPVRLIMKHGWLACPSAKYQVAGFTLPLPCIGGDWLLLVVRCLPFFLVTFMDTHIFYQITLMIWGTVQGIFCIDVGVVNDWDSLRQEFHHAPLAWWSKCMSNAGNANRLAVITARRAGINLDALAGTKAAEADGSINSPHSKGHFRISAGIHPNAVALARLNISGGGCSPRAGRSPMASASSEDRPFGHTASSRLASDPVEGGDAGAGTGRSADSYTSSTLSFGSSAFAPAWAVAGNKAGRGAHVKSSGSSGMTLMLQGRSDEDLAMWEAFASTWDAIVTDLREADLLSDAERGNLEFVRLAVGGGDGGVGDTAALDCGDGSGGGVRPILLPAFFYAGQIQRVVDTGMVTPAQCLVLSECRSLFVFLGAQLGLLPPLLCQALLGAAFCSKITGMHHSDSRQRMLKAATQLVVALQGLSLALVTATDGRRREGLLSEGTAAVIAIVSCLEFECHVAVAAVAKRRLGLWAAEACTAELLLTELGKLQGGLLSDLPGLKACLLTICTQAAGATPYCCTPDSAFSSRAPVVADPALLRRVVHVLHTMLTAGAEAVQPSGAEALRVLGFFMSSMSDRQLGASGAPPPLDESPSHTVLTPCYEEDVIYPINARIAAQRLGCPTAPATSKAGSGSIPGIPDLLTESEDHVSLMSYLRSMFPKDWENFKQRLGHAVGRQDMTEVSEEDFAPGAPLASHQLRLQLWASFRGQLLARTVRGMMAHDKALRLTARLEHPCPLGVGQVEYDAWLDSLVEDKFNYVVSSQVYGVNRHSRDPRQRLVAEGVNVLLREFPRLKVAFIDTGAPSPHGAAAFSVLIRGCCQSDSGAAVAQALYDAAADDVEVDGSSRLHGPGVEEMYRVRLPPNPYTKRGPIIGEGKPENQNHAAIFCFGEALQTIDMNQDNHVSEALKMRNLLTELRPEYRNARASTLARAPLDGSALHALSPPLPATTFHKELQARRQAECPVALVGFREWIFSDKSGAIGSYAAAAELAFGTIVQRTMSFPAEVRMHYGHPDVFNKLHVMTRGGVSKATRQLHVSEDIFAGFNHVLRGGRIKYCEYMSVGKGRDMGFDTINASEIKISGGNGELVMSRDLWRVATRLDFFRLLHFYHSGTGFYLNSYITMATVYLNIFALLFFALARSSAVLQAVMDEEHPFVIKKYTLADTINLTQGMQLGTLSILPYLAQLLLEVGPVRAVRMIAHQVLSGSLSFFIFRQQTTSHYFADVATYGGATYLSTGRGFNITTSHFLKIFTHYARSHTYLGFDLASMAVAFALVKDCDGCSYGGMTWGAWLVAASLILAPFWFNPMTFDTAKVARDFKAWSAWINGAADPSTGLTWHGWNRKQLEKVRNDRHNQTDHSSTVFFNILLQCTPVMLLALAAASRLELAITVATPLALLSSSWLAFAVSSTLLWLGVIASVTLTAHWRSTAREHRWRIFVYCAVLGLVILTVAYFSTFSRLYQGPAIANIALFLYANFNLLLAAHRAAAQLCTVSPRGRAMVDAGYHAIDSAVGYTLLAVVGLLSFFSFVAKLQATLLFSSSFARSVRRGSLVRAIGTQRVVQEGQLNHAEGGAALAAATGPKQPNAVHEHVV